jgi:hypothetical protein
MRIPADLETESTNAPSAQATRGTDQSPLGDDGTASRRKLPRADLTSRQTSLWGLAVAAPTNAGLG